MNVIHINGLSAFLFRQRLYQNSNNNYNNNNININGTIIDKINAIKLACRIARKSSPCILNICLDDEIVKHDNNEISFDEENRLLSIIKEELMNSSRYKRNIVLLGDHDDHDDDIPPLFIIIGTKTGCLSKNGPILTSLMNDSYIMNSIST